MASPNSTTPEVDPRFDEYGIPEDAVQAQVRIMKGNMLGLTDEQWRVKAIFELCEETERLRECGATVTWN